MVGAYGNKCGCCDEAFDSRNMLFQHLRSESHAIVSDSGSEENVDSVSTPGAQASSSKIKPKDLEWRDIGSGTVTKTFKNVKKLYTTTRRGPPMQDIHIRRIWSLSKGKLIDECEVEQTPDRTLHRELAEADDIRVELVLKGAQSLYMRSRPDVAEIYSNPRICQEATAQKFEGINLRPGWSLDLSTKDPTTGMPWDLSDKKVQSRVIKLIRSTEPFCIVGSPPCTPFSQLQGLNKARRDPKTVAEELRIGKAHMNFCIDVYRMQMRSGRHFAHEHPAGSTAWNMPEVKQFILEYGIESVKMNMCSFGMTSRDEEGIGLVAKPTRILSSSPEILKRVDKPCCGGHRHVHLISGKAKAAQVYPRKFCTALCAGIAAQRKLDDLGMVARPLMSTEEMKEAAGSHGDQDASRSLHEEHDHGIVAYDDLTGDELKPSLMKVARREEIKYFKEMGVYEKVSVDESYIR
jgi:hypothetical protein